MYKNLSDKISNLIINDQKNRTLSPFATLDNSAIRRVDNPHDYPSALRSDYIRDIDKIINCPYFSRYEDKTQVFSLYKNDDISHRSLHVQLVSRIARTIGKALNLNTELIEAIALGHDIGHTPFGHAGEYVLNEIFKSHTGKMFFHNVQSVRVLSNVFPYNISLQTLDGILCHNGELELDCYKPKKLDNFVDFDKIVEKCYTERGYVSTLIPSTLEGCIVRISDIIAYLGKDRQDAKIALGIDENNFSDTEIGYYNAEIINNLSVNIIENSYGKPYIKLDKSYFNALQTAKKENYELIYFNVSIKNSINLTLKPMMEAVYEKLLSDLINGDKSSPIFLYHINYVNKTFYKRAVPYENNEPNQIVVDYLASMTDDYFIDLFKHLFPNEKIKIVYHEYFN